MSDLDGYDRESQVHDDYHLADRPEMGQHGPFLLTCCAQHGSSMSAVYESSSTQSRTHRASSLVEHPVIELAAACSWTEQIASTLLATVRRIVTCWRKDWYHRRPVQLRLTVCTWCLFPVLGSRCKPAARQPCNMSPPCLVSDACYICRCPSGAKVPASMQMA